MFGFKIPFLQASFQLLSRFLTTTGFARGCNIINGLTKGAALQCIKKNGNKKGVGVILFVGMAIPGPRHIRTTKIGISENNICVLRGERGIFSSCKPYPNLVLGPRRKSGVFDCQFPIRFFSRILGASLDCFCWYC